MSDPNKPVRILSFGEAVRRRPGMYIGDPGPAALQRLLDEVVSNAIDQYLAGEASRLSVEVSDDGIEICDDGPGLPFDRPGPDGRDSLATHYLTTWHNTARADDHAPHVHIHSMFGGGLALVNHCSERFTCRSWRNGNLWEQRFEKGFATSPPHIVATGSGRGSTVQFCPDVALVQAATPRRDVLRATLLRAAHLFAGIEIAHDGEIFRARNGLGDYVRMFDDPNTLHAGYWNDRPVFHWHGRYENYRIDAAATGFGKSDGRDCVWRTWVNGRSTPLHGTHRSGFAHALQVATWWPATVMLHVITHDPRFAGPTRDEYVHKPASKAVRAALAQPLDDYCRLQRIGRYAKK